MAFYDFFKNIFLLLIFATITPFLIEKIKQEYLCLLEPQTSIGIVTIIGDLYNSSPCINHLHSFFKNSNIKGIIIKIDSSSIPAGTSYSIFNEINYLKKKYPKPIITLVENVCISGAYLIASSSDYIVAPESALIGGIGTYSLSSQIVEQLENHGIYYNKHTATTNVSLETTHNDSYQYFVTHIATSRKLSLTTASNWAKAKIFTGKQAVNLGLINALGSMQTVIDILKNKALIDSTIEFIEHNAHHTATPCSIVSFLSKVQ